MNFNKSTLIKSAAIFIGLCLLITFATQMMKRSSMTLSEYREQNPVLQTVSDGEMSSEESETISGSDLIISEKNIAATENLQNENPDETVSTLTGATLNKGMTEFRTTYQPSFYYEPLSENLKHYITGVSYPSNGESLENISFDDLYYVHVLHYDFEGNPAEGELICNRLIAQDIVEIFYELYHNEYFIEKILLIDNYDADDTKSMEDNNTSCFNYRFVENSTNLSKHALGLAIDINPLYNPYITYAKDGTQKVSPASSLPYADRSIDFPYKIDKSDLCYQLFTQHGFTWGGNWNSCKDYQHFQKNP